MHKKEDIPFNEDRFWLLVSLRLSGEATATELVELENILSMCPAKRMEMEALQDLWQSNSAILIDPRVSFNKHLQRLNDDIASFSQQEELSSHSPATHKNYISRILSLANSTKWIMASAACVLLACVYIVIHIYHAKPIPKTLAQNAVYTKPASKTKILLPDGTQVWLNADSKIDYDDNFTKAAVREVALSGEAFFDVAKDAQHPFIIHTKTVDIKVIGTAFNVRSYSNEKNTETSLIRGAIEVTLHDNPGKKILLKPNDKLIVPNHDITTDLIKHDDNIIEPKLSKIKFLDSVAIETLWTKNQLVFDNEPLESIALKIERWYGVEVIITDNGLKSMGYSAIFEDESLEQVMKALQITGKFNYVINKKQIIISP